MPIQKWSERIWVVTLGDEPMLSEDLLGLLNHMHANASAASMPHMVLDLSSVTRLNSSNISQLLRLRKLAIDRDARLQVVSVKDGLWALFMTTGLDKVFAFSADVPNALATLQMEA